MRALLVVALAGAGCVSDPPIEDAPCPCAPGFVCCAATQRCAEEAVDCPPDDAPDVQMADASAPDGRAPDGGAADGPRDGPRDAGPDAVADATPDVPAPDAVAPDAAAPDGMPLLLDRSAEAGLAAGHSGGTVTAVDPDDDGVLDLYLTDTSRGRSVLYQAQGAGRYRTTDAPWRQSVGQSPSVLRADLDADGVEDLLAAAPAGSAGSDLGALLLGEPGGFGAGARFDGGRGVDDALRAVALDLDGDGALEVFGALDWPAESAAPATPWQVWRRVDGRIVAEPVARDPERFPEPVRLADLIAADLDRDGDTDVAGCGDEFVILINQAGTLVDRTADSPLPVGNLGAFCADLEVADVNGDGHLDLLGVPPADDAAVGIWIFQGSRFGTFAVRPRAAEALPTLCPQPRTIGFRALDDGRGNLVVADFDLDGDVDLLLPVAAGLCTRPAALYENRLAQGVGEFARHILPFSAQQPPGGAILDDVDSDGAPDVVVHSADVRARPRLLQPQPDPANAWLAVRPTWGGRPALGARVELDLDGPEVPDFAAQGRAVGALTGSPADGDGRPVVWFGLGPRLDPVWVRVTFADGTEREVQVQDFNQEILVEHR